MKKHVHDAAPKIKRIAELGWGTSTFTISNVAVPELVVLNGSSRAVNSVTDVVGGPLTLTYAPQPSVEVLEEAPSFQTATLFGFGFKKPHVASIVPSQ